MMTCSEPARRAVAGRLVLGIASAASVALAFGAGGLLGGCASDDSAGHSRTVSKRTYDTPTETKTVTETREKDTKVYR